MLIELNQVKPEPIPKEMVARSDIWGTRLNIEPKSFTLISAHSGKGKSTLLHLLYGLRNDYSGEASIDGQSLEKQEMGDWTRLRSQKIALLFQELRLFPKLSAQENITLIPESNPQVPTETEMAERLGMSRSSFMNAHGLTEKGHLSTAADTAILMVELIKKFPEKVLLLGQLNGTAAGKKIEHSAGRLLIDHEQAILAKTGYTRAAGFNGVLLAESGNRRLVTVMFGGKSTKTMIAQISKLTTSGFIKAAGG